jgi:hypothetical protein
MPDEGRVFHAETCGCPADIREPRQQGSKVDARITHCVMASIG